MSQNLASVQNPHSCTRHQSRCMPAQPIALHHMLGSTCRMPIARHSVRSGMRSPRLSVVRTAATAAPTTPPTTSTTDQQPDVYDTVVVGAGISGLCTVCVHVEWGAYWYRLVVSTTTNNTGTGIEHRAQEHSRVLHCDGGSRSCGRQRHQLGGCRP